MKVKVSVLLMTLVSVFLFSCHQKKMSDNIITHKPKAVKKKATQTMSNYKQSIPVKWLGNTYTIEVARHANSSLPLADDGNGNKYYDNEVSLRILRSDHTEFVSKTFTKANFKPYMDGQYLTHGALLGVVFDKVQDNYLYFACSVGSPDQMSDEYIPFLLKISHSGEITIYKDNQLDTDNREE